MKTISAILYPLLGGVVTVSVVCNVIQYKNSKNVQEPVVLSQQAVEDIQTMQKQAVQEALSRQAEINKAENEKLLQAKEAAEKIQKQEMEKSQTAEKQTPRKLPFLPEDVSGYDDHISFWFPTDIREYGNRDDFVTVKPAVKGIKVIIYDRKMIIYGDFQSNTIYRVTLDGVAPYSENSRYEISDKEQTYAVLIPPPNPSVSFQSRNGIYPLKSSFFQFPVRVVNPTDKARVTIRRIYDEKMTAKSLSERREDYSYEFVKDSREISQKVVPVIVKGEKSQVAGADFEQLGIPRKPGLYRAEIELIDQKSEAQSSATTTFLLTDLAISSAKDDKKILLAVKSFETAKGIPGVTLSLYSRKGLFLGKTVTDTKGLASLSISEFQKKMDSEDWIKMVYAEKDGDISYVTFDYSAKNYATTSETITSDDGACGRDYAYVYASRGICAPGEKMTVFSMVRGGKDRIARANMPVQWRIHAPDRTLILQGTAQTDANGLSTYSFDVPENSSLGTFSADLYSADILLGSKKFTIAEYIPNNLKIRADAAFSEDKSQIVLKGMTQFYFGAPLANGKVTIYGHASWGKFKPKKFSDFVFEPAVSGRHPFAGNNNEVIFAKRITSEEDGSFLLNYEIPQVENVTAPVNLSFEVSAASKTGGRAVSTSASVPAKHFASMYLGLKEKSETANRKVFEWVAVSPEGEEIPLPNNAGIRAELFRAEWEYRTVQNKEGGYSRQWQYEEIFEAGTSLKPGEKEIAFDFSKHGKFILRLKNAKNQVLTQIPFWFFAGEAGVRSENPEVISFKLDREKCMPGDTVTVTFDSALEGTALAVTGSANMENQFEFPVKRGENTFKFTVPADVACGYYFAGISVCGKFKTDTANPIRQFGTVAVAVDQISRKLDITLSAPEKAIPNKETDIRITLKNAKDKMPAAGVVQLWAVDAGILALTNFHVPDPYTYFFGFYNNCNFDFYDNYNDLIKLYHLDNKLIGGGRSAKSAEKNFAADRSEMRKKAAVVLLDTISVPQSGEATVKLKVPDFTGCLTIMATAANTQCTGSTQTDMIVRDELALKVTSPRVLSPNDTFQTSVEVFNNDLPDGNAVCKVDGLSGITADGKTEFTVSLKKGGSSGVNFQFKVNPDAEKVAYRVHLTMNGKTITSEEAVTVRSALPLQPQLTVKTIEGGKTEVCHLSGKHARLEVGSPVLAIAGALEFLNEYPYGCLEQITSGAFPYLAVKPLVKSGLLPKLYALDAESKIASVKVRLKRMECGNGFYSMWPEGNTIWYDGSVYACHFLLEAHTSGYELSQDELFQIDRVLSLFIQNRSNYCADRIYANYALSLINTAKAGTYAEMMLVNDSENLSMYSEFLLGATLIRSGRASEGVKIIQKVLNKEFWNDDAKGMTSLNSRERRLGLALWVLSDVLPDAPENLKLAMKIVENIHSDGHWGTTQSNAWCVLGLSRWAAKQKGKVEAQISAEGKTEDLTAVAKPFAAKGKTLDVTVKNTGTAPVYTFAFDRVTPDKFIPAANGFQIRKVYLDQEGNPVTKAQHGDLLTVKITIRPDQKGDYSNLVLCDLLPAGLEIEDNSLASRISKRNIASTFGTFAEKRYDRFLMFGDIHRYDFRSDSSSRTFVVSYQVRATIRGKFALPPVQLESMYSPELRATDRPADVFEIE